MMELELAGVFFMGIFKGKDELIKSLLKAQRPEDKKGIEAEIEVGELLGKYLPENTYIIAQPEIGELQPDLLVISPKYGFRLIEIKNHKCTYIDEVLSNGVLKTRYGTRNPLNQVRLHAEGLKRYLESNYPYFKLNDPYRNIGYCVIHRGFSKREFEYKFADQLNKWDVEVRNVYFKKHLFYEEINKNFDRKLADASKYPNVKFSLTKQQIGKIVENIKTTTTKRFDDTFYEKIDKQEEKLTSVNNEVLKLKEEFQEYKYSNTVNEVHKNNTPVKRNVVKLVAFPLLGILLISLALLLSNNFKQSTGIYESIAIANSFENLKDMQEEYVKLNAKVERFYYDSNSGTKFLTLTDGQSRLEAVIFSDTKVPFINEGDTLTIVGYIQPTKDQKGIELKITGIE